MTNATSYLSSGHRAALDCACAMRGRYDEGIHAVVAVEVAARRGSWGSCRA